MKKIRNLLYYKDISMEYFNYTAIPTEDEILLNEINRAPGFYKGAEYLSEVYR